MHAALLLLGCTSPDGAPAAPEDTGAPGTDDTDTADADTSDTDTADADTGGAPGAVTLTVTGTLDGEAYAFTCGGDATAYAYATFPEGAGWSAGVTCRSADAEHGVDVVATDAEVGRTYTAADAPSFNAFRVQVGDRTYDYTSPSSYALTFTTADVDPGRGVALAGTFSGTWTDAALTGTFAAYASAEAR